MDKFNFQIKFSEMYINFQYVIYNRLKESCEQALREQQAGYRSGRGCSDQIFVLRNIIEQYE